MHVLIYSCMSKLLQSCIYCNSSPQHDKTCNCNFDSRVTYLIGVLFLIGVFLPDLCVCSSVSVQLSWSQLERKKGVFERDLDLNPLTVGLSIFWTTLKSSHHSLVNIFTGSFSSKKNPDQITRFSFTLFIAQGNLFLWLHSMPPKVQMYVTSR